MILAARLAVEGMVEELINAHADVNAVDDHGAYIKFNLIYLEIVIISSWNNETINRLL